MGIASTALLLSAIGAIEWTHYDDLRNIFAALNSRDDRMRGARNGALFLGGLILLAYGTFLQSRLTIDTGFAELFLPQVLRGLSSQMCFLPLVNLALGKLPVSRVRNAAGLFNLTQRLGAAIGIAGANALLQIRAEHHYARLIEMVPRGSDAAGPLSRKLQILFESRYGDSPLLDRAVTQFMTQMAQREALILAYNDVMLVIAAIVGLSTIFLPAMRGLDRPRPR